MRQFNFTELKKSMLTDKPLEVVTQDGRKVSKIIEIEHRISREKTEPQLLVIIEDHEEDCGMFHVTRRCSLNGLHLTGDDEDDLFFKPQEKTKYILIDDIEQPLTDVLFNSLKEAQDYLEQSKKHCKELNVPMSPVIIGTVKFKN